MSDSERGVETHCVVSECKPQSILVRKLKSRQGSWQIVTMKTEMYGNNGSCRLSKKELEEFFKPKSVIVIPSAARKVYPNVLHNSCRNVLHRLLSIGLQNACLLSGPLLEKYCDFENTYLI